MSDQLHGSLKNYSTTEFFDMPNPNVRDYFTRVALGQSEVYHTPWLKGKTNDAVLQELQSLLAKWMPHLAKLKQQWPSLYKFEKDLAAKVGPMSVMKPLSDRMDDIDAYYEGILLPAAPVSKEALAATIDEFQSIKGLRIRSSERTAQEMRKSTSSGTPFFTKRKRVLKETLDSKVTLTETDFGRHSWQNGAILGWRGQEGGPTVEDVKQRVIWMFPFAVNLQELRVYQPLIAACQAKNLVPAWVSMDAVDERITALFDTKSKDDLIVCTDFTKFDQHFNPECSSAARTIIESLFSRSEDMTRWLEQIFPIKYQIPLLISSDQMVTGHHGMGSGSGGTNADETLLHRALQHEAALNNHKVLNPNSMCLGDDGILTYPGITAKDVTESYSAHGLDMNLGKQSESAQDCTYLRRWHHTDYRVNGICVGVYSTARALGRLCMQERFYDPEEWGPKMVALRELSIIENCKWHPLKEEFAEFCMARDKYRLGIDIPGFLENIESIAQEAIDNMPDFLGYTKSMQLNGAKNVGISDWWIVKYLKSKA